MPGKAEKLLERMKRSQVNWKRKDFDSLYTGFGFIIMHGSSHDRVMHPDYPELGKKAIPRHNSVGRVYVRMAIKLITDLKKLQED